MKAQFTALLAIALLSGCGGGSAPSVPDYSKPVQNALTNIAASLPQTTPYTGSFVTVSAAGFSVAQGFILGTSERNVVEKLAQSIVAEPVKNAVYYQALLSDAGLRFTLMGERVGTGVASGLPLYAADTVYVVKLTTSGLLITN